MHFFPFKLLKMALQSWMLPQFGSPPQLTCCTKSPKQLYAPNM